MVPPEGRVFGRPRHRQPLTLLLRQLKNKLAVIYGADVAKRKHRRHCVSGAMIADLMEHGVMAGH